MRAPSSDPVVGKHGDVEIHLDGDGLFWASTGEGRTVRDKTFKGLEKKIDDQKRFLSREALQDLPIIALTFEGGRYYQSSSKPVWIEGKFQGVNAHTWECAIITAKARVTVDASSCFFRADDPKLAEVKAAVQAFYDAQLEADRLDKKQETLQDRHGLKLTQYRRHGRKSMDAADAEAALVRFLKGE